VSSAFARYLAIVGAFSKLMTYILRASRVACVCAKSFGAQQFTGSAISCKGVP
jgi:hypothetical protein